MKFRPINDIVVVQPDAKEARIGHIILAESAQQEATHGTVIAVGPGKMLKDGSRLPMEVKAGDRVLFTIYAKESIIIGGKHFVMMRQDDIGALLDA